MALPTEWKERVLEARSAPEVVFADGDPERRDHTLALVRARLQSAPDFGPDGPSSCGRSLEAFANRDALKLRATKDAVALAFAQVPPMPESWSTDLPERRLAKRSRMILAAHCPRNAPAPRADWISPPVDGPPRAVA